MRHSYKARYGIACAMAGMLALSGCSGGDSTDAAGGGGGEAEAAEPVVLRYSTQHTEGTPFSRATAIWADMVEERTEGRVTVEMYYSAALLPAAEVLPGIMDGRADTGFVVDVLFPDLLPLTNSSAIPFDRTNGVAQAKAYHAVYENNPEFQAEFEDLGVHVLLWQPPAPTLIGSKTEITGLDDLKGKNIRCIGYICNALESVGANPVALASNEIYEAMDRSTIDGFAAYPFQDYLATQFQEVTPFVTDPGIGQYIQPFSPINLDTWESISAEDQEVLGELATEYYDIYAAEANGLEEETCAATTEAGVQLSTFPEEDVEQWQETVRDDIYQRWVQDVADGSDLDAEAFYEELMTEYESALADTEYSSLYAECVAGEL